MAAKLKLKTVEPGLSPERKALAQAINSRNQLRTRLGHLQAAASDMQRDSWALQTDLDAARKHIAEADDLAVENELNRRMGRPLVSGMSPTEARQSVDNLEDQVSTMQKARQHVETQLATIKSDLEFAESAVYTAADK
jgi:predicted  nucleic acid-binding Zn-ribbon protein